MKTDWPEIFWLGLFTTTGLIGILIMLPINDQVGIVRWIEALGGWAAALVAIPSIILLLRQNSFSEEQSRQARSAALTARSDALRYEYRFVSDVIRTFREFDFDGPNVAIVHKDDRNQYAVAVINSIRKFRSFITDSAHEVGGLNLQHPSEKLLIARENFLSGLHGIAEFLDHFKSVLNDLTKPGVTEIEMAETLKAYHHELHQSRTTERAINFSREWQAAISHELGATQGELNSLSGLH
jgi:hypothetical protein